MKSKIRFLNAKNLSSSRRIFESGELYFFPFELTSFDPDEYHIFLLNHHGGGLYFV